MSPNGRNHSDVVLVNNRRNAMSITKEQSKTALKLYREHLIDNHKAGELADMIIELMDPVDLDAEIQNIVELCDIEPDGTY